MIVRTCGREDQPTNIHKTTLTHITSPRFLEIVTTNNNYKFTTLTLRHWADQAKPEDTRTLPKALKKVTPDVRDLRQRVTKLHFS